MIGARMKILDGSPKSPICILCIHLFMSKLYILYTLEIVKQEIWVSPLSMRSDLINLSSNIYIPVYSRSQRLVSPDIVSSVPCLITVYPNKRCDPPKNCASCNWSTGHIRDEASWLSRAFYAVAGFEVDSDKVPVLRAPHLCPFMHLLIFYDNTAIIDLPPGRSLCRGAWPGTQYWIRNSKYIRLGGYSWGLCAKVAPFYWAPI